MEEDTDDRDDTKRRSRNLSEKKRRDQFNSLVNDLSALISTSNRKMDKSTVLKSTITFLKHHNEATDRSKVYEIQQEWKPSFLSNDEFTQLMLEALDGFIIVFGSRGSICYASDSVTAQLGYLPCDLLKMSIFDLSYEMDHDNLLNIFLNPKPVIEPRQTDITPRNQITFFLHLKRGGVDDCGGNSFELVKFVGYFRNDVNVDVGGQNTHASLPQALQRISSSNVELDHKLIFVGTGRLQMPQMIREIMVADPTCTEFTSKHSMEWKFLFLDQRAPPIIGYMPFEVLGTSGYDYYHFDDIDDIVTSHTDLMQTGKGKSGYYRFLTKGQQWIWLQTDFYISYNQFNTKPDYVVCTHKVITYKEVLKYHKSERKKAAGMPLNSAASANANATTSTMTLRELATTNTTTVDATITTTTAETTTEGSTAAVACTVTMASTASNNVITVNSTSGMYSHPNVMADILRNETSPSMDSSTLWTNPPTPTGTGACHLQPMKSNSRPASCYDNISSTGVSPNVKRKRYMYNCRGNESDSTSMSADSVTSRQSLRTHMSTNRQRHTSSQPHTNFSGNHHEQQSLSSNQHLAHFQQQQHHHHHQQQQQQHQHLQPHHTHQQQMTMNNTSQAQGQKIFQSMPQHAIVSASPMTGSTPCQFSHPNFPMRSPQIVIDSPQYLTAIPVQPVIAPFQVTPVISPLPVSFCTQPVSNDVGLGSFTTSSCHLKNQHDMLAGPVVMTSTQSQLQEQLQRKHDELQKLIIHQQDELRMVSEQLLFARYPLLQPMMSMNYGQAEAVTMGNNTGNFNFNNNAIQQQFNQYGFAMNSNEMNNQQLVLQHQIQHNQAQRQQHQMQQQQQHQHQHQQLQHQQQSQQHMQQTNIASNNNHQIQQQQQQQQLLHQQHDEMLLNRNVPDLDQFAQEEFDAFLNLSPLQNIVGSETALNQITANTNTTPTLNENTSNANIPSTPAITNTTNPPSAKSAQLMEASPYKLNSNNPATTSEDSLFSYIQMAAESSHTINFNMVINDAITTEAHNEDTKLLSTNSQAQEQPLQMAEAQTPQPTTPHRQSQRSSSFCSHPFPSIAVNPSQVPSANNGIESSSSAPPLPPPSVNNNGSRALTNELNRMLPYQLDPEPLQNLFNPNSSRSGGPNQ